jgi:hypothetical protein
MKFIGLMLVVNWGEKNDVGFLRLNKNSVWGYPKESTKKSQLYHLYEIEGEIILKPAGQTMREPCGRDANTIISRDVYWLEETADPGLIKN